MSLYTRKYHRRIRRHIWTVAMLLAMASGLLTHVTYAGAADVPADSKARAQLVNLLGELRGIKAIQSTFLCEKKLRVLTNPFFSRGVITIARPRKVRFQTNWPYRSCYILNGRDIYMRGQSDSKWRRGTVDSQPAIGIIMRQFAAWSLGNAAKASSHYQVSVRQAVRPAPAIPVSGAHGAATVHSAARPIMLRLFTLRPGGKALKRSIREIQLGFAPTRSRGSITPRATPHSELVFIRIVSVSGDQSLFWLRHNTLNPRLKQDIFAPVGPA